VHPYDDPAIIAGQGTIALEMLEEVADLDMLVIPIGGGGLIAGNAIAARGVRPAIEIVGVEAALYPSMRNAITGANDPIGGPTLAAPGTACNPDLAIYNGGGGTEWYFFTTPNATACAGLTTGQTLPYPGKVSQSGKNLVINVPLPPDVSTKVANHANLYGSLIKETVITKALSIKVHGKTVYSTESVACKGSSRPYSVAFTAVPSAGAKGVTQTVKGSAKC